MFAITTKALITRVLAFAGTLIMSVAAVSSLPKYKERRQRQFAAAATQGNVNRLQLLYLAGANVNSHGGSGAPLFLAAREGQLKAVRYLLDQGADVNARGPHGHSALAEATYYGHLPVIRELAVHGADVNAKSEAGTPLDIAVNQSNTAVIDLLKYYGAKRGSELP